jgi:hypothetical protein
MGNSGDGELINHVPTDARPYREVAADLFVNEHNHVPTEITAIVRDGPITAFHNYIADKERCKSLRRAGWVRVIGEAAFRGDEGDC